MQTTIAINLTFAGDPTDEVRAALDALASVMLVQAEDGLYTLGSPDAEGDVENEFLGHFIAADVVVC